MNLPLRYACCCVLAYFAMSAAKAQGIITSIAGNGITQYIGDGSPATSYSLAGPKGIWVDKNGAVYVANYYSSRLSKILHDTLSTISGHDTPAYYGDGGKADTALLGNPEGVCMDTAGNLFITDWHYGVVRKIDAVTNIITTVCGNGTNGFSGDASAATAAELQTPYASCVDNAGNIYIADYGNSRIRKVSFSTGDISTIAGTSTTGYSGDNGPAVSANLSFPSSICLDAAGNIYFSETGNHTIRKINAATGIITTIAGTGAWGYTGDNGRADSARLSQPNSVFVDKEGYIYISDFGNNVIRAITPDGIITTIAGTGSHGYSGDGGPPKSATFRGPTAVFADDSGYIYIADGDNSVIRKMTPFRNDTTSVGIKEVHNTSFHVFPNPNAGKFTITTSEQMVNAAINVYNVIGQCVCKATFTGNRVAIDISGQPAGMYYVQYISQQGNTTQKIVVR